MTRISKDKEDDFREWIRLWLRRGKVPTPTNCLMYLGNKVERTEYANGGPTMSGVYTKIRIEEFEAQGLVMVNGRWRFPNDA